MESGQQIGPYTLVAELGRGGMGSVWRARRADLDRDFALKLLLPGADDALGAIARLQREAETAASLSAHPGIVGVHDVGPMPEGSGVYCAMDLVEGHSLDTESAGGDVGPERAAALTEQAARAVQFAHENNVLHRDLKPANLMVTPDGTVRVTDFGLARFTNADADVTRLTLSGEIVGTPAYMPPEQARGEGTDARADVYALGATLYELLAGAPPFVGDSVMRVMAQVLRDPPPPLRTVAPNVPAALEAIVLKCLEKVPADRYSSAGALADDLRRYQHGEPTEARPLTALGKVRRKFLPVLCAAGVLALILGFGVPAAMYGGDGTQSADSKLHATEQEAKVGDRSRRAVEAFQAVQRSCPAALTSLVGAFGRPNSDVNQWAPQAIAEVDRAAAEVTKRFPESHSPEAWRGFARAMTRDQRGFDRLRTAATVARDDIMPSLLLTTAGMILWSHRVRVPGASYLRGEVHLPPMQEGEEAAAIRRAVQRDINKMRRSPMWSALPARLPARDLLETSDALYAARFAEAETALRPLRDDPVLGGAATHLLGVTLYMQHRFQEAAELWERSHDGENRLATYHAALGWAAVGTINRGRPEVGVPAFDRALANFTSLIDENSLPDTARRSRAMVAGQLAEMLRNTPRSRTLISLAVGDLTTLTQSEPEHHAHFRNRAGVTLLLARDRSLPLDDRLAHALRATSDLDRSARAGRTDLPQLTLRSQVEHLRANLAAEQGIDPEPYIDAALAANRRARDLQPDRIPLAGDAGRLLTASGRLLEKRKPARALELFRAAIPFLDRVLEAQPDRVTPRHHRARCHAQLTRDDSLDAAEREGHADASLSDYALLLERDPKDVEALRMRAAVLINTQRLDAGQRALEAALKLYPAHKKMRAMLDQVLAFRKRTGK